MIVEITETTLHELPWLIAQCLENIQFIVHLKLAGAFQRFD